MATSKTSRRQPANPKVAAKRIALADDTTETYASARGARPDATSTSFDDRGITSTPIESWPKAAKQTREPSNFIDLTWIKEHWFLIAATTTVLCGGIIFGTKLDSKVDVLGTDVKDLKTSVDKLRIDGVRATTQVEHLQRSVGRLEDRSPNKK